MMSDTESKKSHFKQTTYYPWQQTVWQQLFSANVANNHFPHAILLSGVSGIGKKDLAFYLAKALLCQSPKSNPIARQAKASRQFEDGQQLEPCQQCRACQLFRAGNHPDLYHLSTPEDKKVIPVDSVRELIQWSLLNSQLGGKKVILIEPAEAMNPNAANSLLKTLEEPVSNTIIILLSNKKQALLPTIRSRCQTIDLSLPESECALHWLKEQGTHQAELILSLASGAPLLALNLARSERIEARNTIIEQFLAILIDFIDPVQAAETLSKLCSLSNTGKKHNKRGKNKILITPYDVLYWIDSIVSDMARLTQNCSQSTINNIDHYQNLQQLSNKLVLKKLLQLSDSINKAYYEIQGQINIHLLFEKLFIDWQNCKI